MNAMKYLMAMSLLLPADFAIAADKPHEKAVDAWLACQATATASDEARQREDLAGRAAVVEYVIERCGFRPAFVRGNERLSIDDGDCAALFDWSRRGVCAPEDTVALDLWARALDPRVFNRKNYENRCEHYRTAGRADHYPSFRKSICEARQ